MRVAGDGDANKARCQARFLTENQGLVQCANFAQEVHHITPESWCIENGVDPNAQVGLPLCRQHHRGLGDPVIGDLMEPNGCFHPDMNQALIDYRNGNKDAFREAAHQHHLMAQSGERIVNGDWTTDEFYAQIMLGLATQYLAEHPDDPKPETRTRRKVMEPKKWYDVW